MKSFLSKGFSFFVIFSLAFMSNLVVAVAEAPEDVTEVCESQTLVSAAGEGMVPLTYEHEAWTASIPGAEWVWSTDGVSDPVGEVTETFSLTFNIDGVPSDATLEIAADNEYVVTINDDYFIADTNEDNYSSSGQDTHIIPASELVSGENTIEFEVTNWAQEGGTPENNPAGLMYKLIVNCTSQIDDTENTEESCPIVYARVNFSKMANGADVDGWRNWEPGGDLEPQTFVGGSDAGSMYADEVWFPLTNADGTFIVDNDIATYRDVPGLAIERQAGKVRLVIYGYHDEDNGELGGKEFAAGVIELNGATWTPGMQSPLDWSDDNSNPRTHDPLINDPSNQMENRGDFVGYINQYDYRFDRMKTWTPEKVQFHLVVTAGSDGFYATYNTNEDCNDQEPPCTADCNPPISIPGCMDEAALNYDSEATEDDGSCDYPQDVTDDGDDDNGGGGSSSGSRQSSGGGNGGGEVLGATTMCSWDVNTYMRRGYKNDPAQVMILQRDLLNGYMNAGVAVDGIYGPSTEAAVMAFQVAKQDKVLKPWFNLFRPTGIFYKTTLVEAKNTICPEEILPIPTDLVDWSKNPGEVPPKI